MKTYKQRTESILQKTRIEKKQRKDTFFSVGVIGSGIALTALTFLLFFPYPTAPPSVTAYKNSEYYAIIERLNEITYEAPMYKNNFEKWTAFLGDTFGSDKFGGSVDMGVFDETANNGATMTPEFNWGADEPSGTNSPNGATGGYEGEGSAGSTDNYEETTDNQVAGVIEGDRLKRTETHFFYYDESYTLRVYKIAGENTVETCAYPVKFNYKDVEMYLSEDGDRVSLIGSYWKNNERYTGIVTLDVSDPTKVVEVERNYLSGYHVSSRLVDGKLLIINNFYLNANTVDFANAGSYLPQYGREGNMQFVAAEDIVCPENADSAKYTVVCEIDQKTGNAIDCTALLSYSGQVYVSKENIFLTRAYTEVLGKSWENRTEITQIYYDSEGLEYVGGTDVAGNVRNQYSMDEYDGMLRVVTTTEKGNDGLINGTTNASLYCIELENYQIVGKVESFAPDGEEVRSVRFDEEKAYVCTAVVITFTDPVYAFDLSDPNNITYTDTGVIDGYSSSLVQFTNGTLLGIGYGASGDLKIEIYEETKEKVESVDIYEASVWFSEEYKAYFIDRERGLIGLGVTAWKEDYADRYLLLRFDGYELVEVLFEDLTKRDGWQIADNDLKRAALVDEYFYIFSRDVCKVVYLGE